MDEATKTRTEAKNDAGAARAPQSEPRPAREDASRRLARILRDADVLPDDELLTVQRQHPDGYLGDVLVKEGILLEGYLQSLLIRTLYVPWMAVEGCEVTAELWALLPESFCRERRVLPISRARDFVTLACVNPLDEETVEQVRETTGQKVRLVLCSWTQLEALMKATKAKLTAAQNPEWMEEEADAGPARTEEADDLAAKTAELAGRLSAQAGKEEETNGAAGPAESAENASGPSGGGADGTGAGTDSGAGQ